MARVFPGREEPTHVVDEGKLTERRFFNNAARPSFVADFSPMKSFARTVQRGRKAVRDKAIKDSINATETGRRKRRAP